MNHKYFGVFFFMFFMVIGSLHAQYFHIQKKDGTLHTESISSVNNILFPGNNLQINYSDEPAISYALQDIRKMYFGTNGLKEISTVDQPIIWIQPNPVKDNFILKMQDESSAWLRIYSGMGQNDAYHGSCINTNGNLSITGGSLTLYHAGDGAKGLSTDGQLHIAIENEGVLSVTTTGNSIEIQGGGPPGSGDYDEAKTITSEGEIIIDSGTLIFDSADDAIKSTVSITVNGGMIDIEDSEEGIESPDIIINGGEISLNSHDDGFNATYGNGGENYDGSLLQINEGYIYLNSTNGDPLDSNGDIEINGGVLVVHGPQSSPEVGMDVNGSCWVNGGFMVVSGTNSNMTEGPSNNSDQPSVLLRSNQSNSSGTLFHIEDADGNTLVTFAPNRTYYSMIFSSGELELGETYKVYTGGSCTGNEVNGLYEGGTYSGGTLRTTFTMNNMAQMIWF